MNYMNLSGGTEMHQLFTSVSTIALLTASAALSADASDAQVRNLENRVSALEQRKGASSMINPSGRPEVKDGADMFFTADLLIWQAHENGLPYVIKNKGADLSDSSTKEMHYHWEPGVRLGIGLNTPHDGWDLHAHWTYFHSKAQGHTHAGNDVLYPTLAKPSPVINSSPGVPSSARSKLTFNLNMIDLELGREFFVSKWLTLRPFIGPQTTWIYQDLNVRYKGYEEGNYRVNIANDYWGIGLRPGLNSQWGLGCGFSIFGNTALSLLYGFFEVDQKQGTATTTYVDNKHSTRVGRAIAEIQLGLRWERMFADDRCHFSVQAGWENLMFFGQNQFDRLIHPVNSGIVIANQGDLTIQGYTLSFRLDF